MSILKYLTFQPIDDSADDIPTSHRHDPDDDINLKQPVDEAELDSYWDGVVDDIHHDPSWFTFDDDDSSS